MNAHTPGPWGISSESKTIIKKFDFMGESNVIIGSASGGPNSGPYFPTNAEANARLIASAPDLLAALEAIASWIEGDWHLAENNADKLLSIRAAIAKATGGQL